MYRVRILDAATHELARLDKPVGRRIVERINWLVTNIDSIDLEVLAGDLSRLYKYGLVITEYYMKYFTMSI